MEFIGSFSIAAIRAKGLKQGFIPTAETPHVHFIMTVRVKAAEM